MAENMAQWGKMFFAIGAFMFLWMLLMGDSNHWDAFERFSEKYGPIIGFALMVIGALMMWEPTANIIASII